jgi:hypothetical protein
VLWQSDRVPDSVLASGPASGLQWDAASDELSDWVWDSQSDWALGQAWDWVWDLV